MRITVNGEAREFAGTLADLLESERGARRPTGIAVAVGDAVVPRAAWEGRTLHAGDAVEIVTAVQGG